MECNLENITVHYNVIGDGRPIIMLHGAYLDHRHMMTSMEPMFEHRNGWKRIYPDLPGHGRTPAEDWITGHDQVLDIVLAFIDNVIPEQSFVLAGMSRGGYLARGVIYRRSASVDGLLLDVPVTTVVAEEMSLPSHIVLAKDAALRSELEAHETELFDGMIVVQSGKVLSRLRKDFFPAIKLTDDEFQAKILANYEFSFAVDKLSEPFDKPTLILLGRQDSSSGYRDAWTILENFPRATFAILDRAGHFLQIEQEDLYRELVNEWLDRVEESIGS